PHFSHLHYDKGLGSGELPAGRALSSGKGTNSLLSVGGNMILPAFQSAFACSIRSLLEDTKFHHIKRSLRGSPPSNISVLVSFASIIASSFLEKTNICPFVYVRPRTSILPLAI